MPNDDLVHVDGCLEERVSRLARCPFAFEGVFPLLRGEGGRRPGLRAAGRFCPQAGEGVSGWFVFQGERDVAGESGFNCDRLSWLLWAGEGGFSVLRV